MCDEHPNLKFLSAIHKVDSIQTNEIPFVLIRLLTGKVYLKKGDSQCFLEETKIMLDELTTKTLYETTFQGGQGIDILNSTIGETTKKKLITFPADIEVHRKVHLPEVKVSEEHKLKNFVINIRMYFQHTLLMLVGQNWLLRIFIQDIVNSFSKTLYHTIIRC